MQLVRRYADESYTLVADKGYDSQPPRETLRETDIRPLVKHRVFAPYDRTHNAQIENDLYNQQSMTEAVNSSVKHSHGSAVRAREWYREFRKIVLICTVYTSSSTHPAIPTPYDDSKEPINPIRFAEPY